MAEDAGALSAAGAPAGAPIRVAIDGRVISDRFPGIGRYVFNLVRGLSETDPTLEIALLVEEGAAVGRLNAAELAGPRCCLVPVRAAVRSVSSQRRVPVQVAASHADVFHATYWVTAFRPGVPTVLSLYDLIGLGPIGGLGPAKRFALGAILRLALSSSRRVITLSEWSATAIRNWEPARGRRVTVTPLAADPSFRRADAAGEAEARSAFGLTGRYVAYLGSFKPHKNLITLVRAWPDAAASASDATLILAGGEEASDPVLARAVAELPPWARARFIGPVPEHLAAGFLTGASAFAFPSLAEGFGLPPLEAMAVGVPVVAANAASVPEVVGDAGLLVEPLATEAWSAALSSVLTDAELARDLSRRGAEKAARFTWEETARKTAAVYRAARAG